MSPSVSVIVTVYKRTTYIAHAIQSVLTQSIKPLEIIVADDFNSSEIEAIVADLGSPIVTYLGNKHHLGVAVSLRETIKICKGDLISILNDDDVWLSDFLSELTAVFSANPHVVLAFCDHWLIILVGMLITQARPKPAPIMVGLP